MKLDAVDMCQRLQRNMQMAVCAVILDWSWRNHTSSCCAIRWDPILTKKCITHTCPTLLIRGAQQTNACVEGRENSESDWGWEKGKQKCILLKMFL